MSVIISMREMKKRHESVRKENSKKMTNAPIHTVMSLYNDWSKSVCAIFPIILPFFIHFALEMHQKYHISDFVMMWDLKEFKIKSSMNEKILLIFFCTICYCAKRFLCVKWHEIKNVNRYHYLCYPWYRIYWPMSLISLFSYQKS